MSIHNAVNSFYLFDQEPSWMRCERYDYCEPADRDAVSYDSSSRKTRGLKGLFKTIAHICGLVG